MDFYEWLTLWIVYIVAYLYMLYREHKSNQ